MNRRRNTSLFLAGALPALIGTPSAALACAACYGQSDSPMANGMNWGILSLLAVVVCVLGGIAAFFIYLARKAAAASADQALAEATRKAL